MEGGEAGGGCGSGLGARHESAAQSGYAGHEEGGNMEEKRGVRSGSEFICKTKRYSGDAFRHLGHISWHT